MEQTLFWTLLILMTQQNGEPHAGSSSFCSEMTYIISAHISLAKACHMVMPELYRCDIKLSITEEHL